MDSVELKKQYSYFFVKLFLILAFLTLNCKEMKSYLPLNVGNRWEYQLNTGLRDVYYINKKVDIDGVAYYKCRIIRDGDLIEEVYFCEDEYNQVSISFNPPLDERITLIPPITLSSTDLWVGGNSDEYIVEIEKFEKELDFQGDDETALILTLTKNGRDFSMITLIRGVGIVDYIYYKSSDEILHGRLIDYTLVKDTEEVLQ